MTEKAETTNADSISKTPEQPSVSGEKSTPSRREIPGNLPYLTASGTLKKAMDKLIEAQRPERFSVDFLENVLKLSGGGARATIPIFKKMGFLSSDGSPTDLYAKFRTESGRGAAALQGLKNAFQEIFRKSEYAHSADEGKLKDIIVEITGLKPGDQVAAAIRSTFNVIKSYIPANIDAGVPNTDNSDIEEVNPNKNVSMPEPKEKAFGDVRLSYNINIVLPETSDLNILNAIFRSVKENLMR